jgi:alpha-tubulin suppressor-like RCC1 family protein
MVIPHVSSDAGSDVIAHQIGDDELPSSVPDVNIGGSVVQITAGENHTCVLLASRSVRCWGYNSFGQLGYGVPGSVAVPAAAGDVPLE